MRPLPFIPVIPVLVPSLFALYPPRAEAASVMGDYGVSTTGYVVANSISANTISATGTMNAAPPTATNNVATKAYVDSAVAAAGGTSTPMCFATTTKYNGNLGGMAGADAKCAAAFGAGWTFATVNKLYVIMKSPEPYKLLGSVWYQPLDTATYTCSNWSASSGSGNLLSDASNSYQTQGGCSNSYPILCCNF